MSLDANMERRSTTNTDNREAKDNVNTVKREPFDIRHVNKDVLRKLLLFTLLMFSAPFIAYLLAQIISERFFGVVDSSLISAVSAVIMVQIVLVGYIIVAIREEPYSDDVMTIHQKKDS